MPADRQSPATGGHRQAGQTVTGCTTLFYQTAPHYFGRLALPVASHQPQEVAR